MRFLGLATDRRGAAMWEVLGGERQKDTEIPQSYNPAWLPPPAPAVGFRGSADLVLENWSRVTQVIKPHLPGCMLLTFVCVSITQMPQILSLQDWTEDWAAGNSEEGSISVPSAPAGDPRPVSSTSLTASGSLEEIWRRFMFIQILMPAGLLNQRWSYKAKKFTARL